ncbi:P-loop NTPase fold protein [Coraliomargarita sp. SDUM461004]|uniref:P-loop NTPase fold protein n=1 Tax=Thalassobacterium sedimentorum TaxID=3041258 RepID=A0ABU1AFU3_9BACT|nr:Qat anti-phage system ATPase QatA [Coraliomargarita sp. SDUM461004]MDQ8193633.1 P-loop NTPase fold protein [Coraliomargarita sp. SDUM461004]
MISYNLMFFNDNETDVDLLQYEPIAVSVIALLDNAGNEPISIGLHGDWGAGKSSVLAMVQANLASKKKTLCLKFNSWTFQGFEDAKLVLLESLINGILDARPKSVKVKEQAKGLLKQINWLKVAKHAGGLAYNVATGLPSPQQIGALSNFAKSLLAKGHDAITTTDMDAILCTAKELVSTPDHSASTVPSQVHEFRRDFTTLLDEAGIEKLVILVDDLDRCLPITIIETLEAIRLFLFVERSAFVIAVDETMVEYAVRQHFPDLPGRISPQVYSRNYLEKLIQVPFRIPALGSSETRTYITLLLIEQQLNAEEFTPYLELARKLLMMPWISNGLDRAKIEESIGDVPSKINSSLTLAAQLTPLLTAGTKGNPRQIKRFLNTLILRESIAEARGFNKMIKRPILAKLMLLERFALDEYEQLIAMIATSRDGKPEQIKMLEKGNTKRGNLGDSEPVANWSKKPTVQQWLDLDPKLGGIDLRPYAFVTRDKRMFSGVNGGLGIHEALYEKLKGGALSASGQREAVKKLVDADARAIFDTLREDVLKESSLASKPNEMEGLILLAESHPNLQLPLIDILKSRTPSDLGAWVVSGWNKAFSSEPAQAAFKRLYKTWMNQTENKALRKSATATAKINKIET